MHQVPSIPLLSVIGKIRMRDSTTPWNYGVGKGADEGADKAGGVGGCADDEGAGLDDNATAN